MHVNKVEPDRGRNDEFEVNGIILGDQELPFPVRASTPGRPNGIRSDHGTVDSDEPT